MRLRFAGLGCVGMSQAAPKGHSVLGRATCGRCSVSRATGAGPKSTGPSRAAPPALPSLATVTSTGLPRKRAHSSRGTHPRNQPASGAGPRSSVILARRDCDKAGGTTRTLLSASTALGRENPAGDLGHLPASGPRGPEGLSRTSGAGPPESVAWYVFHVSATDWRGHDFIST